MKNRIIALILILIVFSIGFYMERNPSGEVAGTQSVNGSEVFGIILPHHDLARELIQTSYDKIKENNYSYIVIFGPNHFYPDDASVTTSRDADPSFDNEVVNKLLLIYPDIIENKDVVLGEHSIMLQTPHIKHAFGDVPIVPLIISPYAGTSGIYEKLEYLLTLLPTNTLFIASVDFAHYQMLPEALLRNDESISAISNFDYRQILKFKDNHMDSPNSIALLMKAMESRGYKTWETWESSHGAILLSEPQLQGTSYVVGVFR